MMWPRTQPKPLQLRQVTGDQSVGVLARAQMPKLVEIQILYEHLHVRSAELINRMLPLRLPSGMAQVWALAEHVHDDQTKALVLALVQAGFEMAVPQRVIVPPAVLGELERTARLPAQQARFSQQQTTKTPGHVLLALLDDLIEWALKRDASNIHLTIYDARPMADIVFTIDGLCHRPEIFAQCSRQIVLELLCVTWMTMQGGNGAVLDQTREQQGRFERWIAGRLVALRWASLVLQGGLSVCWRLLSRTRWRSTPSLEQLGYTDAQQCQLRRALSGDGGLVVFAGLVGSGKSTTLAALMRAIPATRKVITLEDPVEYNIANALQCSVSGYEQEVVAENLASKLKTVKRSAAHDVLIGELRDPLGGRAVLDLVMSGTNVYTTVHAGSALQIMLRLGSNLIGVPESLMAVPGFLKLMVYQVLLPSVCPSCSIDTRSWLLGTDLPEAMPTDRKRDQLCRRQQGLKHLPPVASTENQPWRFRAMLGCKTCAKEDSGLFAGYAGRIMIAEMIEPARVHGFYEQLMCKGFAPQVAAWQLQLARECRDYVSLQKLTNGPPNLASSLGYTPVAKTAWDYVLAGHIDPRDYWQRFGVGDGAIDLELSQ
jgi:general secretion pathway protein E